MEKIALLNIKGEKLKDIKLDKDIFGIEVNNKVLHDAIILTRASLRQGTHDTKNVSEVSGGGRKPWRQKGTGHARQGSIRSTQWVGGGVPFGPTPRDYSIKMNRKERRLALLSALTDKANDMVVVDELNVKTPKTKEFKSILEGLKLDKSKVLIIVDELEENLILASRNLYNVVLISAAEINTYDLIAADKILTTESAIRKIEEVLK